MKRILKKIIIPLGIILFAFFTLKKSFNLSLMGDDWLAFFIYDQHLGPRSPHIWNHLTFLLTPYGSQQLMAFLRYFYGYQPSYYFITNFFFRMIASFSFFPLVYYLTKNKVSAYFAVLFFAVTVVGLDATHWVFNMTSFFTIALFNLFLYLFLKNRETNKWRDLFLGGLLYYIGYIITPVRMHGSLLFLLLLELLWFFQNRDRKTLKRAAIRFAFVLSIFLFIRFTGTSMGPPIEATERLQIGLSSTITLLSQGRTDFLFYPLMMLGSMFIPDLIHPFSVAVLSIKQMLIYIILPSLFLFLACTFFIVTNINKIKDKSVIIFSIVAILWSILVIVIQKLNINTLTDGNYVFSLLIGGYASILMVWFMIRFNKNKLITTALFISFFWTILSFFFAWWWSPLSIFPTVHRYLIVSAVGITIFFSTIISLGEHKRTWPLLSIMALFVLLNINASRRYLDIINESHSQQIANRIWSSIPFLPEIGKDKDVPIVFYFEGDGINGVILHDSVTFGFPPHISLLYQLREENPRPVVIDQWSDVVAATKNGEKFKPYGYSGKPLTTDHLFAFHLQGQDNLINITDLARKKLKEGL